MSAPKGNEFAKDNPGGGRKSAYEEHQDAAFLADVWNHAQDVESLENKVKGKRYSGREVTALRLLKGSERLMVKFMDKLVPDLHSVDLNAHLSGLSDEEKQKVAEMFTKKHD